MEIDFIKVIISVFGLILFMVPGFILVKTKMIPMDVAKHLSTIVLYICTTALMFLGFQKCEFTPEIGINILITAGLSFVIHMLVFLMMVLLFKPKSHKNRAIVLCSTLSNCGFMGIPFLAIVFGDSIYFGEIMVYCSIVLATFFIVAWTFGVYIISGDKKQISIKKVLLNPVIISIAISLVIFVTIKIPFKSLDIPNDNVKLFVHQFISVIESIGNMVTPLSMIIVGMMVAGSNLKQLFLNRESYVVSFFKLIVMPIITTLVVLFLPIDSTIKYTLFFLLAMPSATICSMFALKYDGDAILASNSILLSSLLSVVTIPLLFLAFHALVH